MQGNDSTGFLKVSSTLKHFAAYSQETGRVNDPVVVTAQDMADTYLPAFEAGVTKARASGLMCSYNAETYGSWARQYPEGSNLLPYNGVPSCANKGLLNDLARTKWKFDGYVTTGTILKHVQKQSNSTFSLERLVGFGRLRSCGLCWWFLTQSRAPFKPSRHCSCGLGCWRRY